MKRSAALIVQVRKNRRYEELYRMLTEQITRFLFYPQEAAEETLAEGDGRNLQNQVAKLEKQYLHEKMRNARQEAEMGRFMENMAHQMKTAVTSLQLRLDMAMFCADADARREALEKSQECMERIEAEIERILNFSRLAAKKVEMKYERFPVAALAAECVGQLEALTQSKWIRVKCSGNAQAVVCGDYFWLQQAISNLLKNALEHSLDHTDVFVDWAIEKNNLILGVENDGEEISAEDKERLFERFYRAGSPKQGYGIGLSMVKDIAEAHHGTVGIGKGKKAGTRFEITLPLLDGKESYE